MRKKLLLTFLPLALIPLIGAGLLSFSLAKKALTQKAFNHLESISSLQQSRIESFHDRNLERFGLLVDRILLRVIVDHYLPFPTQTDHQRLNELLNRTKQSAPDFKSISILSASGKVISSTDPRRINRDYSSNPFFLRGRKSNDFDAIDLDQNGEFNTYFIGPLIQDGTLIGVLLIEENMDQLYPWIKDFSGLGQTGESYIVKPLPRGGIVYLTSLRFDSSAVMKTNVRREEISPLSNPADASFDHPTFGIDYRSQPVISLARFLHRLNWVLVVKIDQREAFQSVMELRNWFLLFFLFSAISVTVLAHFLAKSIVEPMRQLTRMAEEVQSGKPPITAPIYYQKNELGVLAKAFINSAANLLRIKEELELKVSERMVELKQSRSFLNSVIENIPNMIFVKDAEDLRFVTFNKAGEELLGLERSSLIGKNDFDFFPKEEAAFFVKKDREVLNNRRLVDISEEPIHTKKGIRILHTKKIPIMDENNSPKYLLGISEDITERKKTEETLIQKQAELARSNAEREQLELFASVAAHDLQEPLKKIVAFGDLLRMEAAQSLSSEAADYLERMRSAARRMSELISDLLKFSRMTTHQDVYEIVNVEHLLTELLSDLEIQIAESRAEIEIGQMPILKVNRVQFREVFQNLISNAIKFRQKTRSPQIRIASKMETDGINILVSDNGIGFDEKFSERIFRPFERLHRRSEYKGSGVGLAICQRIIANYGGRISVKSIIGDGTTFTIHLPGALLAKENVVAAN